MLRILGLLIQRKRREQGIGVGHIVAHGGQDGIRVVRQSRGGLRLLLEALDHIRMIGIDFDHAELVGLADGLTDAGNGEFRAGFDVLLHHLLEIHTIDMVGADNHHDVGLHVLNDVDGLVDGVGRTEIPMLAETLLRRHRGDVVAQQRRETPYSGDMAVKRMGLVLGKHDRLHVAGIHQIAQRKINQTEHAAEWDGRLGPVPGQWHQTGAFTACQHDGKNLWVLRHGNSSPRASCDTVRTVGPLHHETAYAHYDCINSANRKEFAARVLKISSSFQQRFTMRSCASHA